MTVCVLQNLEKYRVLWTDFSASCRKINWFSVSKISPEPAKPTISLALLLMFVVLKLNYNILSVHHIYVRLSREPAN